MDCQLVVGKPLIARAVCRQGHFGGIYCVFVQCVAALAP